MCGLWMSSLRELKWQRSNSKAHVGGQGQRNYFSPETYDFNLQSIAPENKKYQVKGLSII